MPTKRARTKAEWRVQVATARSRDDIWALLDQLKATPEKKEKLWVDLNWIMDQEIEEGTSELTAVRHMAVTMSGIFSSFVDGETQHAGH